ncbi:MAG: anthranilate synthase component 1, partial [Limisphaerales bacterium]
MITPTFDEFHTLAKEGNLIPVSTRLLADFETPLSAYQKIRGQGDSFIFESVEGGEHLGRYSFVGCNPRAVIRQTGNRIELIEDGRVKEKFAIPTKENEDCDKCVKDGLEVVEKILSRYQAVQLPNLPRFTGGAVGFIGHEFIHDVEPVVPRPPANELNTPTMYFIIADELLVFDRVAQTLTIIVNAIVEPGVPPHEAHANAVEEIERLVALLEQPIEEAAVSLPAEMPDVNFESNMPKDQFLANVAKAKEYIQAGDIIQVVGSQRFSTDIKASPLEIYRAARTINPSPYMFLLELEDYALVGASPEIHVRSEDGKVEIRPIAGTRKRGANEAEDQ